MNEKNVSTALDNTADDIQEARDDNGCDDAEEEDDNEDEEHGEGRKASVVQRKRRQKSSFRTKCIHASAAGGQRHRPSHVVEAGPVTCGVVLWTPP
jgi:hypothetical protein